MLYEQSDTSSRVGSLGNTSSSYGVEAAGSLRNLNVRFVEKGKSGKSGKKGSLPPINYKEETEKVIQAMRLEGEVTEKVRMQIEEGIRDKHKRKAENMKEEKYAYQKMQKMGMGGRR